MKFVALTGGLGNQMFIYAFCEELRIREQNASLFIQHRTNLKKYGHQGYELEKLFDIQAYNNPTSKPAVFLLMLYSQFLRALPIRLRNLFYKLVGIHTLMVPENFIYYPEVFNFKNRNELFRGTWQSEQFFANAKYLVRKRFIFKQDLLSEQTKIIARQMQSELSVSIHIRRGDYLSDQYANGFAGVCTMEYYERAIEHIKSEVKEPHFYIFTDDSAWVNSNFKLTNAIYVQHNTGLNSWQDMYLMSQCKHNIIANSSFSWWGAWLNANTAKMVIAPKLWWRLFEKDDVVPAEWIRL
ncbi:MAG: alpha-1,2-fucosyltransferase [Bacteroidia bacterium]